MRRWTKMQFKLKDLNSPEDGDIIATLEPLVLPEGIDIDVSDIDGSNNPFYINVLKANKESNNE